MGYISLLIKPVSGLCNMRCTYCFYADETDHREQKSAGVMNADTAQRLIGAAYTAAGKRGELNFCFQGGEPTLAGLPFFRNFVIAVRERNRDRLPVHWAIQTNGLGLNAEWADFLYENRFLVGVSVDGTPGLHDRFRPDRSGTGTWDRAVHAVRLLLDRQVDANLLCVVNGLTAQSPKKVYRSLKALGAGYLQFIPCLDPLDVRRGSMPWSLSPEAYGRFLCAVFDEWVKDWRNGQYVSVRQFDDWVHMAMGLPPGTCAAAGQCGGYLVAEADGSLYPCDFYALDEWKLGSVEEDDLKILLAGEKLRSFMRRSLRKPADCASCPHFRLCRGGCPRDWTERNGRIENYFCPAFQMFFSYASDRIVQIAAAERQMLRH